MQIAKTILGIVKKENPLEFQWFQFRIKFYESN